MKYCNLHTHLSELYIPKYTKINIMILSKTIAENNEEDDQINQRFVKRMIANMSKKSYTS